MNIILVVLTVISNMQRHDHWWFYQRKMLPASLSAMREASFQTISEWRHGILKHGCMHVGNAAWAHIGGSLGWVGGRGVQLLDGGFQLGSIPGQINGITC